MKNEITTMNRNSTEQRRTNDAETVEKAMEHKMLKPLTGALKDEKTVLGALEQIVSRCCDGVQSYDREITGCVKKIRKYGPDVSAYMISVDDIQENCIAGNIMRLDYPHCLEVLSS